ncbi:MAG: hypothetical protein M5U28_04860 [Sandaracinaceae bacterium]|nr:hypothetical protein [Sandaracinaceae bacterium]
MRARAVVPAVALLASAAWWTVPSRAEVPALRAFEGTWAYADGQDGRREIERAVARAVAGLPFFAEPIAARRVRELAAPFSRVVFTVRGDRLQFRADGWGPVGARVGGRFEGIPGRTAHRCACGSTSTAAASCSSSSTRTGHGATPSRSAAIARGSGCTS